MKVNYNSLPLATRRRERTNPLKMSVGTKLVKSPRSGDFKRRNAAGGSGQDDHEHSSGEEGGGDELHFVRVLGCY